VIVQSSLYRSNGHGGGPLAGDVTKVYVLTTGTGLCRSDWPQFQRDARRTGAWRGGHDAWIPFSCPAAFVRRSTRDFLGRSPDATGTTYWTSRLHKGTGADRDPLVHRIQRVRSGGLAGGARLPGRARHLPAHRRGGDRRRRRRHRQGATAAEIADGFAADPGLDQHRRAVRRRGVPQRLQARPSTAELPRRGGAPGSGHDPRRSSRAATPNRPPARLAWRRGDRGDGVPRDAGPLARPGGWSYWVPRPGPPAPTHSSPASSAPSEYARRVL
jgi:hypothetical protein